MGISLAGWGWRQEEEIPWFFGPVPLLVVRFSEDGKLIALVVPIPVPLGVFGEGWGLKKKVEMGGRKVFGSGECRG